MRKLLRSLTLGGIVGFFAGLLFAPQKGDKTRKQVQDVLDKGKEKLQALKDQLSSKKKA